MIQASPARVAALFLQSHNSWVKTAQIAQPHAEGCMFQPRWLASPIAVLWLLSNPVQAEPPPAATQMRMQAALENILTLQRPGKDGYATVWDGDKYVQCHAALDGGFICEAGGALMQPSLGAVLTPAAVARLQALGWRYDNRFGNYDRDFQALAAPADAAAAALQALKEAYGADLARIGGSDSLGGA